MKISILSPDLSNNCLGRAYLLGKMLQKRYKVEIIGPMFGESIWSPVANDQSIEYKTIKISGKFKPYFQIAKLAKKIDGDVIYASKPLFTSFGIGLTKKNSRRPLILDIDDWQLGIIKGSYHNLSLLKKIYYLGDYSIYWYKTGSYWSSSLFEKLLRFADEITVSNYFLQKKFGGEIIWHARDTDYFNPERYSKDIIRKKYNIDKCKKVIIFFGTIRCHKGIDDLQDAVEKIRDPNILLMIVGFDKKNSYDNKLFISMKKLLKRRFLGLSFQPFNKVPEFLAMADIVVIPQKRNFATIGQLPAKIFDAMAMAKPIIATNANDLPQILNGCGWIVESENPGQIAKTIQYILNNSDEAKIAGIKAREKCINEYSYNVMRKRLLETFRKYE